MAEPPRHGTARAGHERTSTKCAVQPVILTPASRACRCAWTPLNRGSKAGWMLIRRPRHNLTNSPVKILMKPAKHTISTPAAINSECTAISNSSRDLYAVWDTTCWDSNNTTSPIWKSHSARSGHSDTATHGLPHTSLAPSFLP
jgi:hypothetical protein